MTLIDLFVLKGQISFVLNELGLICIVCIFQDVMGNVFLIISFKNQFPCLIIHVRLVDAIIKAYSM